MFYIRWRMQEMLQILKGKYGEDMSIYRFGKPHVPWWARGMETHASHPFTAMAGRSSLALSDAVEEFLEVMNTRALWERYQL